MHKVFIDNKPLIFADIYNELNAGSHDFEVMSESGNDINDVYKSLQRKKTSGVLYLSESPDRSWQSFVKEYLLVEAAGGLVKNEKGELLVIFRKKHWDLPKGKLGYDESPEAGALREVSEECGINKLKLVRPLIKTFHTYTENKKFVLKKTHWFLMEGYSNESLIPQLDEDIEKVSWMNWEKIEEKVYPKTYASIKEVFQLYFEENLKSQVEGLNGNPVR